MFDLPLPELIFRAQLAHRARFDPTVVQISTLLSIKTGGCRVPINLLVRVEGTPLAANDDVDPIEFVRTIAAARVTMPGAVVRLSAGREIMSDEFHALCFLAGANSIFAGPKLLTTPNPEHERDEQLFARLGMVASTA